MCVFGNVGAFSLSLVIIWVLLCFPHVGLRKHVGSSRKVSHWHKSSSCLEWRWGMVCEKMKIKIEILNFQKKKKKKFPFVLPLSFCIWLVECSGMMQQLRRILQMAISLVMMDGGIKKRYDFCSHILNH